MPIAGLHDIDPRLLSGDPLAFARELADPDRIEHAEANILHAARGVARSHRSGGRAPARKSRKSRPARVEQRKEEKPDG